MPWYLRNLMAHAGYMEEATDGTEGGSVGGSDGGQSETVKSAEGTSSEPASMLEAIESGLTDTAEVGEPGKTEADGRVRGADGRFIAKTTDDAATADAAAAKTAPPAKATDPAAVKTEDDLAMPDGLSQKAQERFTTLVNRVKEREAQVAETQGTITQFREMIQSTGTTPQEFSQAIDYMKMVKHGDFEGALRIMDEQRRVLSIAMGRPLAGVDPLAQFPDLRQRVDGYQMDEQTALEIARSRTYQQQAQTAQQQQDHAQQQAQSVQQSRQQAVMQIDQLGQQWAKTDPDFTVKEDIILKQLPEIARNFPPSQWPQQVKILYNTLSAMPMQRQVANTPAPLRASGQGGGARQPKTMQEAIDMQLGYAGG